MSQTLSTNFKFKAWRPALFIMIGLPVLALTTTKYVLFPPLQSALAQMAGWIEPSAPTVSQVPPTVSLQKILVNPSDTTAAHPIMSSLTLVGDNSAFQEKVNANKSKLLKLTSSALSAKSISDLQKPAVRQAARDQLLADFNRALGGPVIKKVYLTEWPVQ